MAKYLILASYTAEGTKGLMKEGGTKRRAAVEQLIKGVGGKLETFYFAFGEFDALVIADMPDGSSGAAVSMAVNATGAVRTKTVVLLTPEEIDAAAKKHVAYQPPGAR